MLVIRSVLVLVCLTSVTTAIDFPGEESDWHGFTRHDFQVKGKSVVVVAPDKPAEGFPWVWHGEFFGHKPNPL